MNKYTEMALAINDITTGHIKSGGKLDFLKSIGAPVGKFVSKSMNALGQTATTASKPVLATANKLTNAAIQSPLTPDFIRNTFKPGYKNVRNALRGTSIQYGAKTRELSEKLYTSAFRNVKTPKNLRPADAQMPTLDAGSLGSYWPQMNHAAVAYPARTVWGRKTMRHELGHALQDNLSKDFNSLQTASANSGLGNSFLRELHANAASHKTPLGQIAGGAGFAADPNQLLNYWSTYTPLEKVMHGAAVSIIPTAATVGGIKLTDKLRSTPKNK